MAPKCRLNTADALQMKNPVRSINLKSCKHKNTEAGANAGIQRVVCRDCGQVSLIEFRQAVMNRKPAAETFPLHN